MNGFIKIEIDYYIFLYQKSCRRSGIVFGLFVIIYGVLFLLDEIGLVILKWLFYWEMILIVIGLIIFIKYKFCKMFGYVLIVIGMVFLLKEWYLYMINIYVVWLMVFIVIGVGIVVKLLCKFCQCCVDFDLKVFKRSWCFWQGIQLWDEVLQDDFVDVVFFFVGLKCSVVFKNFCGVDIVIFFGGCELNLSQVDFENEIIMDIINIFGGIEIIVFFNWVIKFEIVIIVGLVEDKRFVELMDFDLGKIVILWGICVFGGIEINSFVK